MGSDEQSADRRRRRSLPEQLRAWAAEPQVEPTPGPTRADAVLVAVFTVAAIVETVFRPDVLWRPVALVVAVAAIAALPWRRTHALAVTIWTFGLSTLPTALSASADEPFGLWSGAVLIIIPYALFRWASGRDTIIGLAVMYTGAAVSVAADFNDVGETVAGFVFLMLPIALGALVRARATVRVEQRERVRSVERERLARELHDTVAHHMSAVAVQAQAGRTLAATRPEAAVDALIVIEEAASRSLEDLRNMVRSLRTSDHRGVPPLAPQAGLDELDRLGEALRPGLDVSVEVVGPRAAVPDAVAGALHRIAQESLTNVVRHADRAAHAAVTVTIEAPIASDPGPDGHLGPRVVMTINDDGRCSAAAASDAAGYGLVGMRERAGLLGGRLDAGPGPDGGWSVRCELPIGKRP